MGRISDILPALYYDNQNDLIRFVNCLDVEVKELECKVKGITELVNLDKCPDDKLPYLAALTNCPLMGNDPAMWRRQLRYWPYILKIKGSPKSLDVFLNSIDVDDYILHTFFRDEKDNLVEAKPEAPPFRDSSGLWHNVRTHFFDLDIIYQNEHFLTWKDWHSDFLNSMNIWLTRAKPFHSELRYLNVILRRLGDMPLTVGTATGQAYHHDIAHAQETYSADSMLVTSGAGILQRPQHEVGIIWSTHSEDTSAIHVAHGVVQGGHHDVALDQNTKSSGTQLITAGTGILHRPQHEVGIIWSTGCKLDLGIKAAHGVAQGGHHEVDITPIPRCSEIQALSIAGTVQQKPVYDIEINQAHSAKLEARIASAGIVACGVHTQIIMAA